MQKTMNEILENFLKDIEENYNLASSVLEIKCKKSLFNLIMQENIEKLNEPFPVLVPPRSFRLVGQFTDITFVRDIQEEIEMLEFQIRQLQDKIEDLKNE